MLNMIQIKKKTVLHLFIGYFFFKIVERERRFFHVLCNFFLRGSIYKNLIYKEKLMIWFARIIKNAFLTKSIIQSYLFLTFCAKLLFCTLIIFKICM